MAAPTQFSGLQSHIPESTLPVPGIISAAGPPCVLLASLALFISCAKTGEPQPPLVRVPMPARDLSAKQYGDRIRLNVALPNQNTDGSPAEPLLFVEVMRVMEDRGADPVPVGEEEFLKRAEVVTEITADRLANQIQDGRLVYEDALNFENRDIIFLKGFRYGVRFVNRKRQTAGLSNQVVVAPVVIPDPPAEVLSELSQDSIRLSWMPPTQAGTRAPFAKIVGYNVYRTESAKSIPAVPINSELIRTTEFEDRNFEFEKTYFYAVSVVVRESAPVAESRPSRLVAVPTRDTFPPAAPQNLNAVAQEGGVVLLWSASEAPDVVGFRIYRKELGTGEEKTLLADPLLTIGFRDPNARSGGKYEYRVAAVDRYRNEGPAATVTIEVP